MEMFDQITETRIEPDGKVTVTNVPAEEVENAVADFVWSVREFGDLNSRGDIATDLNAGTRWWRALEYLALADSRLRKCFCGRDRSPASVRLYHRFRLKMIDGRRYRTNA